MLIVLGLIGWDRETFCRITLLMLLAGIANAVLKLLFKIPLPPTLGRCGFAFPSGHMLASTLLYAAVAFKAQNPVVTLLAALLLAGIGYSLVYLGYHCYWDIGRALFFAALLMVSYHWGYQRSATAMPWLLLILVTALIYYLQLIDYNIPLYIWLQYSALCGLIVGAKMVQSTSASQPLVQKIMASLFWLLLTLALTYYLQKKLW